MIQPNGRDILLVVDVQNDFLPGGALAARGWGDGGPVGPDREVTHR